MMKGERHDTSKCSVCVAQRKRVAAELEAIKAKLDSIEEHMAWSITVPKRGLRLGQRVELSKRARRRNLLPKTRHNVRGTIKAIESAFSIKVQLDGQKQVRSYHHAFFNPVSGPKLF